MKWQNKYSTKKALTRGFEMAPYIVAVFWRNVPMFGSRGIRCSFALFFAVSRDTSNDDFISRDTYERVTCVSYAR